MSFAYTCSAMALGGVVLWAAGYSHLAAQEKPQRREAAAAPAPARPAWPVKLKDGQPDMQGFWQSSGRGGGAGSNIEPLQGVMGENKISEGIVVDPPDGRIPYLPWARVRRDEVKDHHLKPNAAQVDTRTRGWPDGVPRLNYYQPFQILQPAGAVVILYEVQHEFRYIPVTGRPQTENGIKLWMGSSRGRWEGNTLVVDVTNISDRVRFSIAGDFATDEVKITERWKFVDADTVEHSATFDDPKVFTRPWTVAKTLKRLKDPAYEIMEYSGVEGDRDGALMVDIPANVKEQKK
jgi:hypothetical protein